MEQDSGAWCKYHMIRGHSTDNCYQLKKEIEKLIQEGKIQGYVKGGRGEDQHFPEEEKSNKDDHREEPKERHTLNTISRGFAGGGESSSSRKKYVRQVMFINNNVNPTAGQEKNITFLATDYEGVVPHDDDPMVITL